MHNSLLEKQIGMFLCGIFLLACSTQRQNFNDELHSDLSNTAVVSVSYSDKKLPSSAIFHWAPGLTQFNKDPRFRRAPIEIMFRNAIRENLTERGYVFGSSPNKSDFLVGYFIGLNSSFHDSDVEAKYQLDPGLQTRVTDSNKFEKGTVVIDLFDLGTKRFIWRGAMEGVAKFEIPHNVRQKRINYAVDLMLQNYFNGE
ncbi:MAG: DUF4136 domain-containing protein [Nitrospinaceae bacterium]|jgi:hypothetical protein|nr:MAG: DUF4136 domain-containing protein [Nitrospinaceae bacterium]